MMSQRRKHMGRNWGGAIFFRKWPIKDGNVKAGKGEGRKKREKKRKSMRMLVIMVEKFTYVWGQSDHTTSIPRPLDIYFMESKFILKLRFSLCMQKKLHQIEKWPCFRCILCECGVDNFNRQGVRQAQNRENLHPTMLEYPVYDTLVGRLHRFFKNGQYGVREFWHKCFLKHLSKYEIIATSLLFLKTACSLLSFGMRYCIF